MLPRKKYEPKPKKHKHTQTEKKIAFRRWNGNKDTLSYLRKKKKRKQRWTKC